MPDLLMPDEPSGGGGTAAQAAPTSARHKVTFHLVDGSTLPAGDTWDRAAIDSLRRAVDLRTRPEGVPTGDVPHDLDGSRTIFVARDGRHGYIIPADKILYVRWEAVRVKEAVV